MWQSQSNKHWWNVPKLKKWTLFVAWQRCLHSSGFWSMCATGVDSQPSPQTQRHCKNQITLNKETFRCNDCWSKHSHSHAQTDARTHSRNLTLNRWTLMHRLNKSELPFPSSYTSLHAFCLFPFNSSQLFALILSFDLSPLTHQSPFRCLSPFTLKLLHTGLLVEENLSNRCNPKY